jgi:hypothetical protein
MYYRTAADETIFGKLVHYPEWQMPLSRRHAMCMIGNLNLRKGQACSELVREWVGVSTFESYHA